MISGEIEIKSNSKDKNNIINKEENIIQNLASFINNFITLHSPSA